MAQVKPTQIITMDESLIINARPLNIQYIYEHNGTLVTVTLLEIFYSYCAKQIVYKIDGPEGPVITIPSTLTEIPNKV